MPTLQIEHDVQDYDSWKKLFDSDPIGRKKSGVSRYRIYRPSDKPSSVIIDLDFDEMANLLIALDALKKLWGNIPGSVMANPVSRIFELMESKEL